MGGMGGIDPLEGWKRAEKSLAACQKTHVVEKGTGEVPKAKLSSMEFQIEVFFANVSNIYDILAKKIGLRDVGQKEGLYKLTDRDMTPEESLKCVMDLTPPIDLEKLKLSTVELKRISDNLGTLLPKGMEIVLNDIAKNQSTELGKNFLKSVTTICEIRQKADIRLTESVDGYVAGKISGGGINEFSPELDKILFNSYTEDLKPDESPPEIIDGKAVGICKLAWGDLNRLNIEVEDENGSRPLFDNTQDPWPGEGTTEKQNEWKLRRIGELLEFFDGDEEKLMKMSQLWLNQGLGNNHAMIAMGKKTKFSGQTLIGGECDGHTFATVRQAKLKDVIKITKKGDDITGVEYRLMGKVDGIYDIDPLEWGPPTRLSTDEESSYFLSIQLTLNKDLKLASPESVRGVVGYDIHYSED